MFFQGEGSDGQMDQFIAIVSLMCMSRLVLLVRKEIEMGFVQRIVNLEP